MKIKAFERYVNQVIIQIPTSYKLKRKIKLDLLETLYAQAEATDVKDPIEVMGPAVAKTLAIGGLAVSKEIAIGRETSGVLMGYTETFKALQGKAVYAFQLPAQSEGFILKFKSLYPHMNAFSKWLIQLFL